MPPPLGHPPVPDYLSKTNGLLTIWSCGVGAVLAAIETPHAGYVLGMAIGPVIATGLLMLPFQIAKPMRRPRPRAWTYFAGMLYFAIATLAKLGIYIGLYVESGGF